MSHITAGEGEAKNVTGHYNKDRLQDCFRNKLRSYLDNAKEADNGHNGRCTKSVTRTGAHAFVCSVAEIRGCLHDPAKQRSHCGRSSIKPHDFACIEHITCDARARDHIHRTRGNQQGKRHDNAKVVGHIAKHVQVPLDCGHWQHWIEVHRNVDNIALARTRERQDIIKHRTRDDGEDRARQAERQAVPGDKRESMMTSDTIPTSGSEKMP